MVEYRGDWKYHLETWSLQRHWKRPKICIKCNAARLSSAGPVYTNFGFSWRRYSFNDIVCNGMGANPSPLILIPGFHSDIIRFCSMHTLNLGILQTMVAECILWLCENDVYAGDTLDVQLQNSYNDFKAWCRRERVNCSQRRFKQSSFHLKADDYPWMNCKAYNCRCMLGWLHDA